MTREETAAGTVTGDPTIGDEVLAATGIRRSYRVGGSTVPAVRGASLTIGAGEMVALRGRSGSGKSTLLSVLGLLARPDAGQLRLCGVDVLALPERARADLRARRLGFVFQSFNLLGHLTAVENVMLASRLPDGRARGPALRLLDRAGLGDRAGHRPSQLSGGEQQRVALVRALVNQPALVIADEPTGNLDEDSEALVLAELRGAAERGCAVLVASHSETVCGAADRVVTISAGTVAGAAGERIGADAGERIEVGAIQDGEHADE